MRNTPWVEGWDGPIDSDIFSESNSFGRLAAFAAASGYEKSVATGLLGFFVLLVPSFVFRARLGLAHRFARRGNERAAGHGRGDHASLNLLGDLRVGQLRWQARKREVLAQRE